MEHYADEVLQACGLSRVNLIYSGGGHCYLLLPHTQKALSAVLYLYRRKNRPKISLFFKIFLKIFFDGRDTA